MTTVYRNEVLFAGYRLDPESGLYQVRNRHYHPTLGRWTQRDLVKYQDSLNLYQYVSSNPVARVDALGLCEVKVELPGELEPEFDTSNMPQSYSVTIAAKINYKCANKLKWHGVALEDIDFKVEIFRSYDTDDRDANGNLVHRADGTRRTTHHRVHESTVTTSSSVIVHEIHDSKNVEEVGQWKSLDIGLVIERWWMNLGEAGAITAAAGRVSTQFGNGLPNREAVATSIWPTSIHLRVSLHAKCKDSVGRTGEDIAEKEYWGE